MYLKLQTVVSQHFLSHTQGKQIQGTFWRHQADRFASSLEEGKVGEGGRRGGHPGVVTWVG
jgi:hypothetical protein